MLIKICNEDPVLNVQGGCDLFDLPGDGQLLALLGLLEVLVDGLVDEGGVVSGDIL